LTPPESARYRWRVGDRNQLSPGAAIVIGVFFGAMGTFVLLQALGTFGPARLSDGTPPWVGVVAGLLFLLGGLAVIVGHGIAGGVGPDGDLPAGTPFGGRVVQYVLGVAIIAMLASIASWVAFGSGSRHFSRQRPVHHRRRQRGARPRGLRHRRHPDVDLHGGDARRERQTAAPLATAHAA